MNCDRGKSTVHRRDEFEIEMHMPKTRAVSPGGLLAELHAYAHDITYMQAHKQLAPPGLEETVLYNKSMVVRYS